MIYARNHKVKLLVAEEVVKSYLDTIDRGTVERIDDNALLLTDFI